MAVHVLYFAVARDRAGTAAESTERLKQDVPIWKREVFEDGSVWVGSGP